MTERDPALLPGATAGEWLGSARLALYAGAGVALVVLLLAGVGVGIPLPVAVGAGVVAVAGFVVWVVLSSQAVRRMVEERERGYATAADVAGLALRDPRTGALERAADELPIDNDAVPLVRRMMRMPSRWTGEDATRP